MASLRTDPLPGVMPGGSGLGGHRGDGLGEDGSSPQSEAGGLGFGGTRGRWPRRGRITAPATAKGCAGCGLGTASPPPQIHTFWVDARNYVEHTRKWYAETIPFPLNFFLPSCMHRRHLERLRLLWGAAYMEDEEKLEKEVRGRGPGATRVGPKPALGSGVPPG